MLTPLSSFSASSAQLSAVIKSIKEQKIPLKSAMNWIKLEIAPDTLMWILVHQFADMPPAPNKLPIIAIAELLAFRERYFDKEGEELEKCNVPGWQKLPPKIARIKDGTLKQFAIFLNRRWKELCRREFYYWDAYWIIKSLIVSNLFQMVKNMLTNFLYCVKKFGFVPNGGRVYYLRRSQPPFLIPMVYEYYEATKDIRFIKENFKYLVEEFEFWAKNRSLITKDKYGKNHTVYQYRTISNVPRPESYRVDVEASLQNLASAAESGWDFSSRWFKDRQKMQFIETTNVVPVDLNALLCWNANILKYLADKAGDETKATEFEKSNRSNLFVYQNGIPTSLEINSGQKWDFPNGWAPLQHIIIEGMRKSHNPDVQELAYKLARKWVLANYQVYQATNQMWDKIDVIGTIPKPGSGGEYKVQVGFGWTNGVILDLLATYYDRMSATEITQEASSAAMCCITSIGWNSWLTSVILAIITGHLYDRFI
ncbi:Alpha-trehalose glucohydrolase [Dirofilaria immitis]|nr:Alpha-trehalose glucohydrolase [Dirofilaria immitis]